MAKTSNNIYEQVYNVSEDASLLAQVNHIICVLVQRGLLVARFSKEKEIFTINYTGYNKNRPVWEVAFFEQLFANEPLLADKTKVKGIFTFSERQLIVPARLYQKNEAENWLSKIHFIERSDVTEHYPLRETKANYLHALPVNITELIRINFPKAATLPAPFYQFSNVAEKGAVIQYFFTAEQVCATLHNGGRLLWHNIKDYVNAEDIAYRLMQVARENNIAPDQVALRCNTISAAEFNVISNLSQYFPGITAGDGSGFSSSWDGAIALAKQLFSCV